MITKIAKAICESEHGPGPMYMGMHGPMYMGPRPMYMGPRSHAAFTNMCRKRGTNADPHTKQTEVANVKQTLKLQT